MSRPANLPFFLLLIALPLLASPSLRVAPGEEDGAKVHKSFNDLYPVAFRVRVNEAIDAGVRWLIRTQSPDGSWAFRQRGSYPMGTTALAALTLLKCGIPKEHPALVKAFECLRPLPMRATYSAGLLLMALDAKYAPARDPFAPEEVDRYGHRKEKDPCASQITPADLAWMRQATAFLLSHQTVDGHWRYPHGGYDTSNTQFALLGLHAATRCGVTIDNQVWLSALRWMLTWQEKTGTPVVYKANEVRGRYRFEWMERAFTRGFRYSDRREEPTGSMTAAGLACLIICQSRLWRSRAFDGGMRTDTRRGIRDAMAWLQSNFAVRSNPNNGRQWVWYYLYGLERAGILGRFRFVGTHDWYKEGADYILEEQDARGSWHGAYTTTCFNLLFLKRATSRMDVPVMTPSGGVTGEMPAARAGREPDEVALPDPRTKTERLVLVARALRDLDDPDPDVVFQAVMRLGHLGLLRAVEPLVRVLKRHRDADTRGAAARSLGRLRAADAFLALVEALDDADDLTRYAAEEALAAITGDRLVGRLAGTTTRNERLRLQKAWRAWWADNEKAVRSRLEQPRGT